MTGVVHGDSEAGRAGDDGAGDESHDDASMSMSIPEKDDTRCSFFTLGAAGVREQKQFESACARSGLMASIDDDDHQAENFHSINCTLTG